MTKHGFTSFKVSHLLNKSKAHTKRAPASCSSIDSNGFYQAPSRGATIQSGEELQVTWDKTCLTSDVPNVKISFLAPGESDFNPREWTAPNTGSASILVKPEWFATKSSFQLQLSIVEGEQMPFETIWPAGPMFTATHNPALSTDPAPTAAVTKGPSSGGIAAAVIVPLLFVGLLIAAYMRMARAKAAEKSKRFSTAVDKRMSTISTDWKSMTPSGATAAIRNSMAVTNSMDGGNRNSSFSFGQLRPSSTVAVEGGQAGVGARGVYTHDNGSLASSHKTTPSMSQMSQLRPGVGLRNNPGASPFADRVSRISFAADTRPSGESRRSTVGENNRRSNTASRAFHSSFVPPMPTSTILQRQYSGDDYSVDAGAMSPTQTQGPPTLSSEDINARISGDHEIGPALSMMRHETGDNEYMYTEAVPPPPPMTPLSPTHVKSNSPAGMMPPPVNAMSPDAMLRAYASRPNMSPQSTGSYTTPSAPAASYNGNGMRALYSPTSTNGQLPNKRYSSDDNNDDAYNMGTAN